MLSHRSFLVMLLVIIVGFSLPGYAQEATPPSFTLVDTISDTTNLEWSVSENKLVVEQGGGSPQSICIWDVQSQICDIIQTYDSVLSAELSPDGQQLAVGLSSGVQMVNVETHTEGASVTNISEARWGDAVTGITWSNDGQYIAVGGIEVVHIINSTTLLEEKTLMLPPIEQPDEYLRPIIVSIKWSPNNEYLAVEYFLDAPTVATLNIFEVQNGNLVYEHELSRGSANWVKQGEFFSHLLGNRILLLDATTFEIIREYPAVNPRHLSWSPNGEYLMYFLSYEDKIVMAQADTGAIIADELPGLEEATSIKETAWSYDGSYLAILNGDQVYIYEVTPPQHP